MLFLELVQHFANALLPLSREQSERGRGVRGEADRVPVRCLKSSVLLMLIGLLTSGCKEDPEIQMDGFHTKPVVYGIIETFDSIHYIKLGRFFSGNTDPSRSAGIKDSIYLDKVNLKVTLSDSSGVSVDVPVERMLISDKNPGIFNSGDYEAYLFKRKLVLGEAPFYHLPFEKISIEVKAPGLPVAEAVTSILLPPVIWSPLSAQQFIYLVPDSPMRILWSGSAYNEIHVSFNVIQEYPDYTMVQPFYFKKTTDVHFNGKYYESLIPYELLVERLLDSLKVRPNLYRTYFGSFRIEILSGNDDFSKFTKQIDGINDFSLIGFNNIANGIGILASKCLVIRDSLSLDLASRLIFAAELRLKRFKFIEY